MTAPINLHNAALLDICHAHSRGEPIQVRIPPAGRLDTPWIDLNGERPDPLRFRHLLYRVKPGANPAAPEATEYTHHVTPSGRVVANHG